MSTKRGGGGPVRSCTLDSTPSLYTTVHDSSPYPLPPPPPLLDRSPARVRRLREGCVRRFPCPPARSAAPRLRQTPFKKSTKKRKTKRTNRKQLHQQNNALAKYYSMTHAPYSTPGLGVINLRSQKTIKQHVTSPDETRQRMRTKK